MILNQPQEVFLFLSNENMVGFYISFFTFFVIIRMISDNDNKKNN